MIYLLKFITFPHVIYIFFSFLEGVSTEEYGRLQTSGEDFNFFCDGCRGDSLCDGDEADCSGPQGPSVEDRIAMNDDSIAEATPVGSSSRLSSDIFRTPVVPDTPNQSANFDLQYPRSPEVPEEHTTPQPVYEMPSMVSFIFR